MGDFLFVGIPVVIHLEGGGDILLVSKGNASGSVGCGESHAHGGVMLFPVFPEVRAAGMFGGSGICNIKHIFDSETVPGAVQQGNALSAPLYISAHVLVPDLIGCTGFRIGPLGMDQDLLMVGIFIDPGCRI